MLQAMSGSFGASLPCICFCHAFLLLSWMAQWYRGQRRTFSLFVGLVSDWKPGTLSAQAALPTCSPHPTPRLPHALQSESQALPDKSYREQVFSVKPCFHDFSELFCLCVWWSSSFPEQWGCTFRSQLDRSILWHHKGSAYHCWGHLR